MRDGEELAALERDYGLPDGWSAVERFAQEVDVGASCITLSGFSALGPNGEEVTGSAASADGTACVTRSYFELLERVSIVVKDGGGRRAFEWRDMEGRVGGRILRGEVFPENPAPDRWRHSRSNGVAAHRTWREACASAAAELVERDRILRSWYGESRPRALALPREAIPCGLHDLAEWSAWTLGGGRVTWDGARSVVAVVGLPRSESTPLTYGFGAGPTTAAARATAVREVVARLGFLLGEALPSEAPQPSPTPDYHQDFYLYPPSRRCFERWLRGEDDTPDVESRLDESTRDAESNFRFVDLTPEHLRGKLWVVRALCVGIEPLVFGEPAPHRAGVHASRRVHPVP